MRINFEQVTIILLTLGKTLGKAIQTLTVGQKNHEPRIGSGTSHFQ